MRVIINGSRWFRDEKLFWQGMALCPFPIREVICGKAKGPDTLGEHWAKLWGIPVRYFKPDWEGKGNAAGMIRNIDMLNDDAEALVSFWDGSSKGTSHTFIEARKRKLPTMILTYDQLAPDPLRPFEMRWKLNNFVVDNFVSNG